MSRKIIMWTENKKEIKRFKNRLSELASDIQNGMELNQNNGDILALFPKGSTFEGEIGNWISGAINCSTKPIGYCSGSGKGEYRLIKKGKVLIFEGSENSFIHGSDLLKFVPNPIAWIEI